MGDQNQTDEMRSIDFVKEWSEEELIIPKIVAMMGLVMTSLLCSCIPYIISLLCSKWDLHLMDSKFVFVLNCITAGFYLGLTFMYFFENARKNIDIFVVKMEIELPYPIVEALVCAGFVLVGMVESFIHLGANVFVIDIGSVSPSVSSVGSHVEPTIVHKVNVVSPTLQKLVVIVSLSIQTLFAGIAIGLQHRATEVFQFMVAIMLYVGVVSFDLGQKLFAVYHRRPLKAFYMAVLFSIVGPVGISVGIAISEVEIRHNVYSLTFISGIFLAISAGIFLHVTFMNHMYVKVPNQHYFNGSSRLLFMISGLLLVSILKILPTPAMYDLKNFLIPKA